MFFLEFSCIFIFCILKIMNAYRGTVPVTHWIGCDLLVKIKYININMTNFSKLSKKFVICFWSCMYIGNTLTIDCSRSCGNYLVIVCPSI